LGEPSPSPVEQVAPALLSKPSLGEPVETVAG